MGLMLTKLLRPCLLALPLLLATSCSIGPGDYVIYRVAFSALQNGTDCGTPGPDQAEDTTDFTISPCNCKGSVKMVHPHCLQTWIEKEKSNHPSKITQEGDGLSKIVCEICM